MDTSEKPARKSPSVEQLAIDRAKQALRLVSADLPHLSGLARLARLKATRRAPVACVASSGLVLVNPDVYATIPLLDAAFVLAHELMHLALDTHGRQGDSDPLAVNFAHDYIINDMLFNELEQAPPLGGLWQAGARQESLEGLLASLKKNPGSGPRYCWDPSAAGRRAKSSDSGGGYPLRRALQKAGLTAQDPEESFDPRIEQGDLIPSECEGDYEPEIDSRTRQKLREQVRRAAAKAASLAEVRKKMAESSEQPPEPQRGDAMLRAIRAAYDTPWERALQRWLDAVAPGERTYLRPSRRRAERSSIVRAGRRRDGFTLHILLDTSGSMVEILPRALGAISYFAENAGVPEVHVVQCDIVVTHDEWVEPEELAEFRIGGFGGSDMAPGLNHLAADPEVNAVLVLTDGYIDYPRVEPPFRVLWTLIGRSDPDFNPPYGDVLVMSPL
jgi:predicted metal-dependent peptidase